MKRIRRMKITTVERQLAYGQSPAIHAYCPLCRQTVETLSKTQAADLLEITQETLDRFIAEGQVHVIQTVSGTRRVCQDSLFPR